MYKFIKLAPDECWRLMLNPGDEDIDQLLKTNLKNNALDGYRRTNAPLSNITALLNNNIDYASKAKVDGRAVLINSSGGYCYYNGEKIFMEIQADEFPEDLND